MLFIDFSISFVFLIAYSLFREVRTLLKRIEIETTKKFRDSEAVSIGSFVFLRFIIPAISGSIPYESTSKYFFYLILVKRTPVLNKFCSHFSSYLQRVSTGKISKRTLSEATREMENAEMNHFITVKFSEFIEFYRNLTLVNVTPFTKMEIDNNDQLFDKVCVLQNILLASQDAVIDSLKDRFSTVFF